MLAGVCRADPKPPSENAEEALGACAACIGGPSEKPDAVPEALPETEPLQAAPNMTRMQHDKAAIDRCLAWHAPAVSHMRSKFMPDSTLLEGKSIS